MSSEFERHQTEQLVRKRRIRRLLRPLPRRGNLARYPVIKWFRDVALKAPFLWSFKQRYVIRAIYAGSIIAFLPLYGFQFMLAFGAALMFRTNLTLSIALQFITNPFTILPIFAFTGWLGLKIMNLLALGTELGPVTRGAQGLFLGGLISGLGCAIALDVAYRLLLWEARRFKAQGQRLRALLHLPTKATPAPGAEIDRAASATTADRHAGSARSAETPGLATDPDPAGRSSQSDPAAAPRPPAS